MLNEKKKSAVPGNLTEKHYAWEFQEFDFSCSIQVLMLFGISGRF